MSPITFCQSSDKNVELVVGNNETSYLTNTENQQDIDCIDEAQIKAQREINLKQKYLVQLQ